MRSVFPPSSGTQKLWSVSAESSFRKVGVGCAGSLAGMCSSFAVTMPNLGYRNDRPGQFDLCAAVNLSRFPTRIRRPAAKLHDRVDQQSTDDDEYEPGNS